jgi:hypothetical protein
MDIDTLTCIIVIIRSIMRREHRRVEAESYVE